MKRVLHGLAVVACSVAVGSVGVAHASAAPASTRPSDGLHASDFPVSAACVTSTGKVQAHLSDGSPSKRWLTYTVTSCPTNTSASTTTTALKRQAFYATGLKHASRLRSLCTLRAAGHTQPTYYATQRKSVNCGSNTNLDVEATTGSGNGWDRTYFYDGDLGNYSSADTPYSCGGSCNVIINFGPASTVSYTGGQNWWSTQTNSLIDVYCR